MQLFRPSANVIARAILMTAAIFPFAAIGVTYGIMNSAYVTGQNVVRTQPIPFSHKHHYAELGIHCLYCHADVEKSPFAGLPATHVCMSCHSQIWTNAAMLAPVRESLASNRPIRWNRVHVLPAYVYFDHSVHVSEGRGLQHLPRPHRCDGADQPGRTADHGLVRRLPQQPSAVPAAARSNLQHGLGAAAGPGRAGNELLKANRIDPNRLIECSTCHR